MLSPPTKKYFVTKHVTFAETKFFFEPSSLQGESLDEDKMIEMVVYKFLECPTNSQPPKSINEQSDNQQSEYQIVSQPISASKGQKRAIFLFESFESC